MASNDNPSSSLTGPHNLEALKAKIAAHGWVELRSVAPNYVQSAGVRPKKELKTEDDDDENVKAWPCTWGECMKSFDTYKELE
jgi:hypothetical protein